MWPYQHGDHKGAVGPAVLGLLILSDAQLLQRKTAKCASPHGTQRGLWKLWRSNGVRDELQNDAHQGHPAAIPDRGFCRGRRNLLQGGIVIRF
eukprot:scaffold92621_cov32-Prasinocladus_malaysianus.AAC.1